MGSWAIWWGEGGDPGVLGTIEYGLKYDVLTALRWQLVRSRRVQGNGSRPKPNLPLQNTNSQRSETGQRGGQTIEVGDEVGMAGDSGQSGQSPERKRVSANRR
ncbi:hypothetical protein AJ79_09415 [Helicocarpus griseus UAMH5409]|uniref:Uncharacterized protein n=1 Tax=Helicocarpus griseus UAMH5409 TaxID=1447875 RepID=A0A2B7WK57_9EURO|nr:hypothetical protein AJ79_09415 [Helicocarpus griseus UAMH5409]